MLHTHFNGLQYQYIPTSHCLMLHQPLFEEARTLAKARKRATDSPAMIFLTRSSAAARAMRRIRNSLRCMSQQQQQSTAASMSGSTTAGRPASNQQLRSTTSSYHRQWYEQSTLYYSNYPLDRAAELRKDESQVTTWFNASNARVTPVNGSRILVTKLEGPSTSTADNNSSMSKDGSHWYSGGSNGNDPSSSSRGSGHTHLQPVWVSPAADLGVALNPDVPPLFLGLDPQTGSPYFAAQIAASAAEGCASSCAASWVIARTAGPDMTRTDAALMAVASGLAQWNLDSQYHGATGSKTVPRDGGHSRQCSTSGRVLYPRIDPAIITLVTAGSDWCLLGRKNGWPQGRYSTLAGFLEIGESLEQALCREVAEESGAVVDLHSVRYIASQPWPFPRSLMVGFYASAASPSSSSCSSSDTNGSPPSAVDYLSHEGRSAMMDTGLKPCEVAAVLQELSLLHPLTPEEGEMEDVRWFNREWLQHALQLGAAAPDGFMIPGNYSLAHKLIMEWLGPAESAVRASTAAADGASCSSSSSSSSSSWLGEQIAQVEIDQGSFKYILMRLSDTQSGKTKLLVRGAAAAAYHNHILQQTKQQVQQIDSDGHLHVDVLGGGRIEHYPDQGIISVYGYSAAFGPAVHEVTVGLLRKWYPFYSADHITCSYKGY